MLVQFALTAMLAFSGPAVRAPGASSVKMATGDKSQALPWAPRPVNLDGTLAGDVGFDPLGFSSKSVEDLYRYREAELKHGRVCMLAVTGMLTQELYSWPAPDGVFKAPTPLGALATVPAFGWIQIIAAIGFLEVAAAKYQEARVPGDYGFDPVGLSKDGINPWYAQAELEHGRLAMWATAAFLVQSSITNEPVLKTTLDWVASIPGNSLCARARRAPDPPRATPPRATPAHPRAWPALGPLTGAALASPAAPRLRARQVRLNRTRSHACRRVCASRVRLAPPPLGLPRLVGRLRAGTGLLSALVPANDADDTTTASAPRHSTVS